MSFQVILQIEAKDQQEAEAIAGMWTVTPGTLVVSVGEKMVVYNMLYGGPLSQAILAPKPQPPMPPL